MKDSGIEWLGEVPAHWEVKRLKHMSPQITVGIVITPSKYYEDEGIPALRSLNLRPSRVVDTDLVFISPESNELLRKSKLAEGDLVAVRTGQPGTTAVVPAEFDGANCIDLIIIRRSLKYDSRFLCHVMNSKPSHVQYGSGSEGAIQQHFNIETAKNLLLAVPPVHEQQRIRCELDAQLERIDHVLARIGDHVRLLLEYRQALISAAVTGKIDATTGRPHANP
jgi:type I restriction enzyme S subunit